MALPDDFSPWEHLQSVLMQVYNREVRDEFNDILDDDDDITTPRSSLRTACLLRDDDSALMTYLRMQLFYFCLRKAQDLQTPVYGIPVDSYQQSVKFRPQVTLKFTEDLDEVEAGYFPIRSEVSFRLVRAQYDSLNEAEARTLANQVRNEFATGNAYRYRKGRVKLAYRNAEQGANLSIHASTESIGRDVISKVLSLQDFTLDSSYLTISDLGQAPPTVPPTQIIYGQSRRLPRRRPVGNVRFYRAELNVWGVPKAILLYDSRGSRDALVR
jgi:hypothetical protein